MRYQSQDSMRLVAIGLVSIVALSMGAASIDSATGVGGAGAGTGIEVPMPGGNVGDLNVSGPETNASFDLGIGVPGINFVADASSCVEPLAAWYGTALYFGAFGGIVYLFKRLYSLGAAVLGTYAVAPVAFTGYFLSTDCVPPLNSGGPNGPPGQGPFGPAVQRVFSPDVPLVLVAGALGVALVGVAAVLYRASGDQTVAVAEDGDEMADRPDVADLAAAAGRAADRLEKHNADVDNAVYRAWWEMTSMLRMPDPETSTPGEFADAAVALGVAESDVSQLTTLFEEVRYGKRDPESREELALDVFRAIEAEYGDDEPAE